MARLILALIILTYGLGAAVIAGVLMRFASTAPAASWALAGAAALGVAQTHLAWRRRAADRATAETLEALRNANLALLDEMSQARERVAVQASQWERELAGNQRAVLDEVTRLDSAVRAVVQRLDAEAAQQETRKATSTQPQAADADIRDALAQGRVDVHMQPILELPQRRTAHYEAFTHLRTESGRVLAPQTWLETARTAGLMPEIDRALVSRAVRAARVLAQEKRTAAIFCNVSAESFEGQAFQQLFDVLRGATDVAAGLVLEMRQDAFEGLDAIAVRNLMRVADFGYRFSLDHVQSLDASFDAMRRVNMRFMKLDGARLAKVLTGGGRLGVAAAPDVLAADYPLLLEREGIRLIAEKVETEATVIELLDFEVRLGQGRLFAAPRPVRDGVLDVQPSRPPETAGLQDDADTEAEAPDAPLADREQSILRSTGVRAA